MMKFLEYNKDLIEEEKQKKELSLMPYENMKNLYLKTLKLYNKKNNQLEKNLLNH